MAQSKGDKGSASKTAFDSLLDLNKSWFNWVEGAVAFQSIVSNHIHWEHMSKEHVATIGKRLGTSAPESQLLINSFYVTLVAGFEEYLRGVIREVVSAVNRSKFKASDIDGAILACQIREAARLLKRMDSPPDYLTVNAEDLCRSLGTCVPASKVVELSVEAFADIESPIKMDNFFGRMTSLGISMTWDVFGEKKKVKEALSFQATAGAREVGSAARKEILRITRFRNRIAHTGGNAADVSPSVMSVDADLLKAISDEIDKLAQGFR